jgi:hypothetical protein
MRAAVADQIKEENKVPAGLIEMSWCPCRCEQRGHAAPKGLSESGQHRNTACVDALLQHPKFARRAFVAADQEFYIWQSWDRRKRRPRRNN